MKHPRVLYFLFLTETLFPGLLQGRRGYECIRMWGLCSIYPSNRYFPCLGGWTRAEFSQTHRWAFSRKKFHHKFGGGSWKIGIETAYFFSRLENGAHCSKGRAKGKRGRGFVFHFVSLMKTLSLLKLFQSAQKWITSSTLLFLPFLQALTSLSAS